MMRYAYPIAEAVLILGLFSISSMVGWASGWLFEWTQGGEVSIYQVNIKTILAVIWPTLFAFRLQEIRQENGQRDRTS